MERKVNPFHTRHPLIYCKGKGANLHTGLLSSPLTVLTEATLITPSFPGKTSVMTPRGQLKGAALSCLIRTNMPGLTGLEREFHFSLDCSWDKYSIDHLDQNDCTIWSIN
uniref:Uncharacterized protein n=1 Tax=Cacopsylla melanoneura TaxID=428564 RepID=A0A8D9E400_9HEMI